LKQINSANGQDLRNMFAAATSWLEKNAPDIDSLNVFPVPDGDTGTNMLLTMRSSIEEAYRAPDHGAATVAQAMAKGALMGARGNSGVILSQILRGLAQGITGKDIVTGKDLAAALKQASVVAYNGVSNPVEGTILTVVRDVSNAAERQVNEGPGDLPSVMEAAVRAAAESVARTPTLLPVLRQAGVVDAGGQGLYTILEGALHYVNGEIDQMQFKRPTVITSSLPLTGKTPQRMVDEVPYGYCTEFLVKGDNLSPNKIKGRIRKKGESLIVVGDAATVRVHIHTLDPGEIIHYATSLGTLHQLNIRNMDEQYQDFLQMRKEKTPAADVAIVVVVAGDGLSEVFNSLGVTAIIPGGQTMNPSTKDILQAVEKVPSDKVLILPNNKNIIPAARQVKELTRKQVEVIPTVSVPQGVAAILSFDYEADFDSNVDIMTRARANVRSIEITRAARSTRLGGLDIKKKQPLGFLDGDMVAVGDDPIGVMEQVFERVDLTKAQVVTLYFGANTTPPKAEKAAERVRAAHPNLQVEVVKGGQPHYDYIISVE
jgi:DAK2 domain fusion protein YloV